jgi:multidrug resistance efflux pump
MSGYMGDAGEGLIDAEARLQERMDELEESRKVAKDKGPKVDPEIARQTESLRLARTELQRQLELTTHAVRREQIGHAVAEIERRLAEVGAKKKK